MKSHELIQVSGITTFFDNTYDHTPNNPEFSCNAGQFREAISCFSWNWACVSHWIRLTFIEFDIGFLPLISEWELTLRPLKTHCDMRRDGESQPELGQERGIRSRRCSLITVCIYISSSLSLSLALFSMQNAWITTDPWWEYDTTFCTPACSEYCL